MPLFRKGESHGYIFYVWQLLCGSDGIGRSGANRKDFGINKKLGGKVKSIHVLLGDHDLVLIVELPGETEAVKASVSLGKMTGISFTTCAALPVDEFDKIISELD